MTTRRPLPLAALVLVLLSASFAFADDDGIKDRETDDIHITHPENNGDAIYRGSTMTVNGTVKAVDNVRPPQSLILKFEAPSKDKTTGKIEQVTVGSYTLKLDEESTVGKYDKKGDNYFFYFNVQAPKVTGEYRLHVTGVRIPQKTDKVQVIYRDRSKPVTFEIR